MDITGLPGRKLKKCLSVRNQLRCIRNTISTMRDWDGHQSPVNHDGRMYINQRWYVCNAIIAYSWVADYYWIINIFNQVVV
jgi:hypothetical protein